MEITVLLNCIHGFHVDRTLIMHYRASVVNLFEGICTIPV